MYFLCVVVLHFIFQCLYFFSEILFHTIFVVLSCLILLLTFLYVAFVFIVLGLPCLESFVFLRFVVMNSKESEFLPVVCFLQLFFIPSRFFVSMLLFAFFHLFIFFFSHDVRFSPLQAFQISSLSYFHLAVFIIHILLHSSGCSSSVDNIS